MPRKLLWVYILASATRQLEVGVTTDLHQRWRDHRRAAPPGFAPRFRIQRLVYVEPVHGPRLALRRARQVARWGRHKQAALVSAANPQWRDLAQEWGWAAPNAIRHPHPP